jgi:hypothetical protein
MVKHIYSYISSSAGRFCTVQREENSSSMCLLHQAMLVVSTHGSQMRCESKRRAPCYAVPRYSGLVVLWYVGISLWLDRLVKEGKEWRPSRWDSVFRGGYSGFCSSLKNLGLHSFSTLASRSSSADRTSASMRIRARRILLCR